MTMRGSKMNSNARVEVGVAMRSSDENTCVVYALAVFLFDLYCVRLSPWPDLSSPEAWYNLSLLNMSYTEQNSVMGKALADLNIYSSDVTHCARRSAARECQIAGCTEESISIHGRWC